MFFDTHLCPSCCCLMTKLHSLAVAGEHGIKPAYERDPLAVSLPQLTFSATLYDYADCSRRLCSK